MNARLGKSTGKEFAEIKEGLLKEKQELDKQLAEAKEKNAKNPLQLRSEIIVSKLQMIDPLIFFEALVKAESKEVSKAILKEQFSKMINEFEHKHATMEQEYAKLKTSNNLVVAEVKGKPSPDKSISPKRMIIMDTSRIKFQLQKNALEKSRQHLFDERKLIERGLCLSEWELVDKDVVRSKQSEKPPRNIEMELLILDIKIRSLSILIEHEKFVNAEKNEAKRLAMQQQLDRLEKDMSMIATIEILQIEKKELEGFLSKKKDKDTSTSKLKESIFHLNQRISNYKNIQLEQKLNFILDKIASELNTHLKIIRPIIIEVFNNLMKRANEEKLDLIERSVGRSYIPCDNYEEFRDINGGEIIFDESSKNALNRFSEIISQRNPNLIDQIIFIKYIIIVIFIKEIKNQRYNKHMDLMSKASKISSMFKLKIIEFCEKDHITFLKEESVKSRSIEYIIATSINDLISKSGIKIKCIKVQHQLQFETPSIKFLHNLIEEIRPSKQPILDVNKQNCRTARA